MPQSLFAVFVHLVWSTKDRRPWLRDPAIRTRLHAYLGGASREMRCPPVIAGGMDDHVHILGQLGREVSIAGWVKELKRVSSIWMKGVDAEFKGFYWQGGYGAFSVSQSNLARVENVHRGPGKASREVLVPGRIAHALSQTRDRVG